MNSIPHRSLKIPHKNCIVRLLGSLHIYKEYRVRDLQIVAGCFERAKEVSMKDFVDAFDNLLTREQIRYLISKMEEDTLISKSGSGRWTKYYVNSRINTEHNIFEQFTKILL